MIPRIVIAMYKFDNCDACVCNDNFFFSFARGSEVLCKDYVHMCV